MQIYINRNNQRYGPYTLEQVQMYLASGQMQGTDPAWYVGIQGWTTLSQVPGVQLTHVPYTAPPTSPQRQTASPFQQDLGVFPQPVAKNISSAIWVCGGLAGFVIFAILIAALLMPDPNTNQSATASGSATDAPVTTSIAPAPPVIDGPTFSEVDAKMDDRISTWTEAQKDAYWATVAGKRIQWNGEVVEVDSKDSGSLTLKCNPNSFSSDTYVDLDGTQIANLASINKSQQISFSGLLDGHGLTGYTISDGHIN